jgi:hypothetical protein
VYSVVRTQERVRIESDVQSLELILDGSCREGKRGDGREKRGRERIRIRIIYFSSTNKLVNISRQNITIM